MIPISTVVVGSGGAATIDFINIPQVYTDLMIKSSLRGDRSAIFTSVKATFNSNTSGYSNRFLEGSGTSATAGSLYSNSFFLGEATGSTATINTFGNLELYIPNYTSSNHKSGSTDSVSENNATTSYTALVANLWANSSQITSLSLIPDGGNWTQHSTATLYGIRKY